MYCLRTGVFVRVYAIARHKNFKRLSESISGLRIQGFGTRQSILKPLIESIGGLRIRGFDPKRCILKPLYFQ